MQNKWSDDLGAYRAELQVATARAGAAGWIVASNWLAFPFAVQTLMHPEDAIRLQLKLQGLPLPHDFTAQQLMAGFVETVIAIAVLVMVQMMCTVLFYRRAKIDGNKIACPVLWPLAAFAGVLGNAGWWYGTGAFDLGGCFIGLSSGSLTVIGEIVCNKLGREFVMGKPGSPALYT